MNGLALCSGVGALELGIRMAIPSHRTVCHVERDAYAASVLVARMEDEALDPAPIWDDLASFPAEKWRGAVDLISAGFPCQPWSVAGKQQGQDDDRWLWPLIARIIRDVGPRYVFLENVRGLLVHDGIGAVLGSLADLGFDAEWTVLRASEVGAPHGRARVFVLAYRDEPGPESERLCGLLDGERAALGDDADGCGEGVAHSARDGRPERSEWERAWPPGPDGDWSGVPEWLWPAVAHTARDGRSERSDGERTREAGEPRNGSPPQPELRGLAHGMASGLDYRADRLRCGGNGVVSLQAAAAFAHLARRSGVIL